MDNIEKSFNTSEDRKKYFFSIRNGIDITADTAIKKIQNEEMS